MITYAQLEAEVGGEDKLLDLLIEAQLEAREEYQDDDAELAQIRQLAAAQPKDTAPKAAAAKPTGGKKAPKGNNAALTKGQQDAQTVGVALTTAAKQARQTKKAANLQVGARQAELDTLDQQTGYLHRKAQLEAAGAKVFGKQLTDFDNAIRDDVDAEFDIESVLGGLDASAPLEDETEDFTKLAIPVGITFFV